VTWHKLAEVTIGHTFFRYIDSPLGILNGLFFFSLFQHNRTLLSSFHFDPHLVDAYPRPTIIPFILSSILDDDFDRILTVVPKLYFRQLEFQAGKFP